MKGGTKKKEQDLTDSMVCTWFKEGQEKVCLGEVFKDLPVFF